MGKKIFVCRVKINEIITIDLSYLPSNNSYILTTSKTNPPNSYIENHRSFHTIDCIITHKITNAGNKRRSFETIKAEANQRCLYVTPNDIDLLRGMHIDKSRLENNLVHWGYFAYNFLHDNYIQKNTTRSNTKDTQFDYNNLINLNTTFDFPAIYIAFYISKNLRVSPETLISTVAKNPIDESYFITDKQDGDTYTFSILVKKTDKFIKKQGSSIIVF